jgi:hypothetical protein
MNDVRLVGYIASMVEIVNEHSILIVKRLLGRARLLWEHTMETLGYVNWCYIK